MASADVELVVSDVSAGNKVGNHRQTVAARSAGSLFDFEAVDQSGGRGGIGGHNFGRPGNVIVSLDPATVSAKCSTGCVDEMTTTFWAD